MSWPLFMSSCFLSIVSPLGTGCVEKEGILCLFFGFSHTEKKFDSHHACSPPTLKLTQTFLLSPPTLPSFYTTTMSAVKNHKRKPFGKSAENALNSKKEPVQKVGSKQDGRGGTSTTRFDPKATEKRRDSKTPKMGNLTSVGGAYDPKKEFEAPRPRGDKRDQHRKSAGQHPAAKLDPSPIKRPDPTTTTKAPHSTVNRPGTKQRGGFVAAAKTKSGRPIAHNLAHASSDTKTVRSTPEKDPPLVMSPLTKPDPIARDEGQVHVEQNTKQPYGTYIKYAVPTLLSPHKS